jgi:Transposase DDE domain
MSPGKSILQTNNSWYQHSEKHHKEGTGYKFRRYVTKDCKICPSRHKCTQGKRNGRAIDRNENADAIEANAKRVNDNPDYYRKRQQIAEHLYGTLKRQRGYTHTNLRGREKVLGETGLFFIGYNLTRCITIMRVPRLIKALRECCLLILKSKNRLILSVFNQLIFPGKNFVVCELRKY